jgi:hypothetical protein
MTTNALARAITVTTIAMITAGASACLAATDATVGLLIRPR